MKKNCLLIFVLFIFSATYADSVRETPLVKTIRKVMPSVVNLSTERIVNRYQGRSNSHFDSMLDEFFGYQRQRRKNQKTYSLGSGSIIDKEGLIVTNSHVVHRATRIQVTLSNGKKFFAEEVASDQVNDIALLKIIDLPDDIVLTPIEFSETDYMLGETVIAIGNPYGLGNTISHGILSAVNRETTFQGEAIFSDLLQTDTAINPGNSGGPLVNLEGKLMGINTAIYKEAQGIGFAIPTQRVENLLSDWLIPERFGSVSLGIIPARRYKENGQKEIFIKEIIKGSPASIVGLKNGDIITKIEDKPIKSLIDLSSFLWKLKANEHFKFIINNDKSYNLTIESYSNDNIDEVIKRKLGIGVQNLTEPIAKALGYPFFNGVVVSDVFNNTADIERGVILVKLNSIPIYKKEDIARAIRAKFYGESINAVIIYLTDDGYNRYLLKQNISFHLK